MHKYNSEHRKFYTRYIHSNCAISDEPLSLHIAKKDQNMANMNGCYMCQSWRLQNIKKFLRNDRYVIFSSKNVYYLVDQFCQISYHILDRCLQRINCIPYFHSLASLPIWSNGEQYPLIFPKPFFTGV
jgi:hypothetical protein